VSLAGIDRPDDFVEGTGCLAGGLGNLLRMRLDFRRRILVGFRHFTQQCHLREICAQLVVQVAGDAGAFLFQRLALAGRFAIADAASGLKVSHTEATIPQQTQKSPERETSPVCQNCGCTVQPEPPRRDRSDVVSLQAWTWKRVVARRSFG